MSFLIIFVLRISVVNKIKAVFPEITFSDPNWGWVDRPSFSIEFNIGDAEIMDHFMLHIRGGNEVIDAIRSLCEATAWRAFDTTTGSFIDFDQDPGLGLRK